MPELPEITVLARQMKSELPGKTVAGMEILQPKCLNVEEEVFRAALTGARLLDVTHRGKWILSETDRGRLLLGLGMGGEILLVTRDTLPEKHRLIIDFDDGTCLAINFWWLCSQSTKQPRPLHTAHRLPSHFLPPSRSLARPVNQ